MNLVEIKEERGLLKSIRERDLEDYKEGIKELDKQEKKIKEDLVKRIKKHFKGVIVGVSASNNALKLTIDDKVILEHTYGKYEFNSISKKLFDTIIREYEEVYGEIEKDNGKLFVSNSLLGNFSLTPAILSSNYGNYRD